MSVNGRSRVEEVEMMREGLSRAGCALGVVAAAMLSAAVASPIAMAGCPNSAVREGASEQLPDCRAYEQVTPRDKNGSDVGTGSGLADNPVYGASDDGNAAAYEVNAALPGSVSGPVINSYLARRNDAGWDTTPLSPPQRPLPFTSNTWMALFNGDMSRVLLRTPAGVAPLGEVPGPGIYLRDNDTGTVTKISVNPPSGQIPANSVSYLVGGASRDLEHIVFESSDALTPDAPPTAQSNSNVYEYVDGHIRLVSVLPDGTAAPLGAVFGGGANTVYSLFHAISDDGSRIVFKSQADGQFYMRIDGTRTVLLTPSQRTSQDPGYPGFTADFAGATADGKHVFFTDGDALTNDAQIGDISLYRFDVDSGRVTNLTVNTNPAEAGQPTVVSGVVGMADDGDYLYFWSPNQLIVGQGVSGQPNLYLLHGSQLSFIASDPGPGSTSAGSKTSVVTPDGRHLLFASSAPLTSYDNTDAVTGGQDPEAYLYDADAGSLRCVSCRPDGTRPEGAASLTAPTNRRESMRVHTLSDDGRRVFFNSTDALVPGDVNGKKDVYEWADGATHLISSGTGDSDSFFAAASANGDDVFFATRDAVLPTDEDDNRDLYDARVGGGFPLLDVQAPCSGDDCQGTPSAAPAKPQPGSGASTGDGNAASAPQAVATVKLSKLSDSSRRLAARTGYLTVTVTVNRGGKLGARATRKVGSKTSTVGSASANAPRAGSARLRMRLSKTTRSDLRKKKTVKLTVRVSFSHLRGSKTMSVELHR